MVTVLRKLSMNGDRSYTGAAGNISNHDGPTVFFEDGNGGCQDEVCWKSVPVFHHTDRKGTAPSSKTAWSLQLSVRVPS